MGTDIHLFVEKQQPDGSWHVLVPPSRDLVKYPRTPDARGYVSPFWGPGECFYEREAADEGSPGYALQWYRNRCYDTFAILADVRNGKGFAGCDTGDGFAPIAYPRGVPSDVSSFVAEHATWDHTPSWLLASEVFNYDWSQITTHRGVIPVQEQDDTWGGTERDSFEEWQARGGGMPKSWSGGISGGDVLTISFKKAREVLARGRENVKLSRFDVTEDAFDLARRRNFADPVIGPTTRLFTQVSWTETYRESASSFLELMDEYVKPLGNPSEIRLVFGFDS
jgi:hypothetical protein